MEYARNCIAAYFGLPAHLAGGTAEKANAWGKTIEETGIQLEDFTLSGYVVPLNEAHSSLLPDDEYAAFDESMIRRADAENLSKLITAKRAVGVETQNEIRVHDLHKRPLPGGDELLIPLNSNTSPTVGTVLADEAAKEEGLPAPSSAPAEQEV